MTQPLRDKVYWKRRWQHYRESPRGYVDFFLEILHEILWETPIEILISVHENECTAVAGCHASGKTRTAAGLVLAFAHIWPDSRVVTTATRGRAVREQLWAEIAEIHGKAYIPYEYIGADGKVQIKKGSLGSECLEECLKFPGATPEQPKRRVAIGFKGEERVEESHQGFHAGRVFFVIDEASSIAPSIFRSHMKILNNPQSRFLVLGNTLRGSGPFYDAFRPGSKFKTFCIDAADTPNVKHGREVIPGMCTREWVAQMSSEFGKDHPFVRMAVHAKFPETDYNLLIPPEWLELSFERHRKMIEEGFVPRGRKNLGCDVAGRGANQTVLCKRQFNFVHEFSGYGSCTVSETTSRLRYYLMQGWAIAIDAIGLGEGVGDELDKTYSELIEKAKSDEELMSVPEVRAVRVSEATKLREASANFEFANLRSALCWRVREALDPKGRIQLAIPETNALRQEAMMTWEFDRYGRILVEPKESVKKKLGGRSPDYFDSLMQTFALPDDEWLLEEEEAGEQPDEAKSKTIREKEETPGERLDEELFPDIEIGDESLFGNLTFGGL